MAWTQGLYTPINQSKYIGKKQPYFRSNWERVIFSKLDENPSVVRWGSELFSIPYNFNMDSSVHKYWIDVYMEMIDSKKVLNKFFLEIKPDSQCFAPKQPKKRTFKSLKSFNYNMTQFHKNHSKWKAASAFSKMNNASFIILTEKGIYTYLESGLRKISEKSFF